MASPGTRIDYRDEIVAHGDAAVPAVEAWLTNSAMSFFACRVLEYLARSGSRAASASLVRSRTASRIEDAVRDEIQAACLRLGLQRPKQSRATALVPVGGVGPEVFNVLSVGDSLSYLLGCVAARGVAISASDAEVARRIVSAHGVRVNVGMAARMIHDQTGWALCEEHLRGVIHALSGQSEELIEPWPSRANGYFSFSMQAQEPVDSGHVREDFGGVLEALAFVTTNVTITGGAEYTVQGDLPAARDLTALGGGPLDHCHANRVAQEGIDIAFVAGLADVAGNCRFANRYIDGRVRVRLDTLNTRDSWQLPTRVCQTLQKLLDIPVHTITWGHPNLGRGLREHQLNIFAGDFARIGFRVAHKQAELVKFLAHRAGRQGCPGMRGLCRRRPNTDPLTTVEI